MSWAASWLLVPASTEAEARKAVPEGRAVHLDNGWAVVTLGDEPTGVYDTETSLSESASEVLGEAIFLWGDTSSDHWRYERSTQGKCVRKLMMLSDGEQLLWAAAQGTPEPWEAQILWNPANLKRTRGLLDDEGDVADLEALWEARRISLDSPWPPMDATIVLAVLRYLGTSPRARSKKGG